MSLKTISKATLRVKLQEARLMSRWSSAYKERGMLFTAQEQENCTSQKSGNNGNLPLEHVVFINEPDIIHTHEKGVGGSSTPIKQVHTAYKPGSYVSTFAEWWVWGWFSLIQIRYLYWRVSLRQILLRDYRATCQQSQFLSSELVFFLFNVWSQDRFLCGLNLLSLILCLKRLLGVVSNFTSTCQQ